jgi:aquaporin Z
MIRGGVMRLPSAAPNATLADQPAIRLTPLVALCLRVVKADQPKAKTMNQRALAAEFIGTFALVTGACGAALFSAPAGGGLVAVAFGIGLPVLIMAFAIGHISGGHYNPAVTLGLVAGGRFNAGDAVGYIIAQVLGGIAAALIFSLIWSGQMSVGPSAAAKWNGFMEISNTFGGPRGFSMVSVILIEVVMAALFLIVVMGSTSKRAPAGFAPIAIGLAVVLFHLVSIPVSNTSLNPARSTATAVLAGGKAMAYLWVFWVAPIVGAMIGGAISKWLQNE